MFKILNNEKKYTTLSANTAIQGRAKSTMELFKCNP